MPDAGLQLAETFAEVARSLVSGDDVEETLRKITVIATSVIDGCQHASIDILEGGKIHSAAASSDLAATISRIEEETSEGPCYDAIREHEVFHSDDLPAEDRWPNFAKRAHAETGIRSMIGFRLFSDADTIGALDLYSTLPGAFDDTTAAVGSVLAAHAAVALAAARDREHLERAIESRDMIGQAKGILMNRHGISADAAFELLRDASQKLNIKLRDVADRTVEAGGVPEDHD